MVYLNAYFRRLVCRRHRRHHHRLFTPRPSRHVLEIVSRRLRAYVLRLKSVLLPPPTYLPPWPNIETRAHDSCHSCSTRLEDFIENFPAKIVSSSLNFVLPFSEHSGNESIRSDSPKIPLLRCNGAN